jgi:hypothetical protein
MSEQDVRGSNRSEPKTDLSLLVNRPSTGEAIPHGSEVLSQHGSRREGRPVVEAAGAQALEEAAPGFPGRSHLKFHLTEREEVIRSSAG